MISRKTIVALAATTLLFVVPVAFYDGEVEEYKASHPIAHSSSVPPKPDEAVVSFDPHQMVDWGMMPWMRWSFMFGVVCAITSAAFLGSDLRSARRRANGKVMDV